MPAGFLLFIFSCGKKGQCIFPVVDPVIAGAATIKEGSYFVYADSVTEATDSLWVIRSRIDSFCDPARGNAAVNINYILSDKDNNTFSFTTGQGITGFFQSFGRVRYLHFPFVPGTTLGPQVPQDTLYDYELMRHYATLHLQGQDYADVYEIRSRRLSLNRQDTDYIYTYYSLNNGMVKYSTHYAGDSIRTRELKRSVIVR